MDGQTDRTTDNRRSEKITFAFSSGELKMPNYYKLFDGNVHLNKKKSTLICLLLPNYTILCFLI